MGNRTVVQVEVAQYVDRMLGMEGNATGYRCAGYDC